MAAPAAGLPIIPMILLDSQRPAMARDRAAEDCNAAFPHCTGHEAVIGLLLLGSATTTTPGNRLLDTLTGTCIGLGALTANRQPFTVAHASVAADLD